MWISRSYIAKVLVWLAAALMPCDMLLAGTCACGERNAGDTQAQAVNTSAAPSCCCHKGAVCQCSHRAQKNHQSACCKNRTPQPVSSHSGISQICLCSGGRVPAPQTPLPDSSAAKQLIGHVCACLGPPAVVEPSAPRLTAIGDCPSIPATSLDRLSTLCRLLI